MSVRLTTLVLGAGLTGLLLAFLTPLEFLGGALFGWALGAYLMSRFYGNIIRIMAAEMIRRNGR